MGADVRESGPLAGAVVVASGMLQQSPAMRGDVIAPLQSQPANAGSRKPTTAAAAPQLSHTRLSSEHPFFDCWERRLSLMCAMTPKSDQMHTQPSPS